MRRRDRGEQGAVLVLAEFLGAFGRPVMDKTEGFDAGLDQRRRSFQTCVDEDITLRRGNEIAGHGKRRRRGPSTRLSGARAGWQTRDFEYFAAIRSSSRYL